MKPHRIEILVTADQIKQRVDELVREMLSVCRVENFVMIGILRGSFMFLADLVRDLYGQDIHPRIDFLTLESYGAGTVSSGTVRLTKDITLDVAGADVMLVDDILDSGRTLSFAIELLTRKGARKVRTCVLLNKPNCRVFPCEADFSGFKIEDVFVVGYGLDYDGSYRELPYIAKVVFQSE